MSQEVNLGYLHYVVNLKDRMAFYKWGGLFLLIPRAICFPLILLYALCLWLTLFLIRKISGRTISQTALNHAADLEPFIDQYPFHYYPILAKGYELAYLKKLLREHNIDAHGLLEFAVGEASLSSRVFEGVQDAVIGCDLNPYSLYQCQRFKHFRALVVADVMNPPIAEGTATCILSMNFLHHVSQKKAVLKKWSSIAETAIFNENSPHWASSSCLSWLAHCIGLKNISRAFARKKEAVSHQSLLPQSEIDALVAEDYEVIERITFLDATTMFLANLSSGLMWGIYGPPTPGLIRQLSKPFRRLSRAVARELYFWDHFRSRKQDVFMLYYGKSKNFKKSEDGPMFVAQDGKKKFRIEAAAQQGMTSKDGMTFILPKDKAHILTAYDSGTRSSVPAEHL